MPQPFIHPAFLLQNKTAEKLYHNHASGLPVVDYHCHLPPAEIAANKQFNNLTDIWLRGDHYKWRAMRALGVSEEYITGAATDEEKFHAWAACVPQTLRNPLFHWTQMELMDPFGIATLLNKDSAAAVYAQGNELLATPAFSTQALLRHFKVELVGTTDDPCDDLHFHRQLADQGTPFQVRPSFRPDPVLNCANKPAYLDYLWKLEQCSGVTITGMPTLLEALQRRVDYFHEHGCRISDHGLVNMPPLPEDPAGVENDFAAFLLHTDFRMPDPAAFAGYVLHQLCRMYYAKGWVQQFHLGAVRNLNSRLLRLLGADAGVDAIGDDPQAIRLARFLDALNQEDRLAKTILYNLNPAFNEVFAAIAGTFNDGSSAGKIQFGSAWWFLDQKDGIEKQLNTLSNLGVLSTFVGMTTDSRSFLSFPRHDYFRRILCNLLGTDVERGLLPADETLLGSIIRKICYTNAKDYFRV